MGSGTTGVAAMMTDRNFVGIEANRNYFAVAKKRIEGGRNPLDRFGVDYGAKPRRVLRAR
jgi:DNA modification methylase